MSKVPPIPPDERISDMSSATPATSAAPTPASAQKPRRVLACMLCQQRKVKCDRKSPCSHCIKSRVQCVPATQLPRQRRRRFPERELLERLRKYEDLLRQNNIKFEPLHKDSPGGKESHQVEAHDDSDDELPKLPRQMHHPLRQLSVLKEHLELRMHPPRSHLILANYSRNVWHAMNQEFREPDTYSDSSDDDVREVDVKKAWDQIPETDNFLFGSRMTNVDTSSFHPEPVQIFRLWQIYLENVNPLLKVTHTPSLQGLIIEAAGNISNIKPNLEALMFGIYCMSITSLSTQDFRLSAMSVKQWVLRNSDDRDSLTALYFYLLSIRPSGVSQSLSSMLAVAIRIAQRMGCHSEVALSKLKPLEAEMRRRLWWSLVLFDARVGEMSDSKHAILTPAWDCRIPLNVSDSDFHIEMKDPLQVQGKPTEAIFAVIRSTLGDFVRHTTFHLDFHFPVLKPAVKDIQPPIAEGSELANLEKQIEDKYLKFCDPENPLHFVTIWTTRLSIAKLHLVEHWHLSGKNRSSKVGLVREATIAHALTMLECDTKLMTSPLVKGFIWMSYMYFPFPAYFQIVQNLKRRPLSQQAEQAWEAMTANYEARFNSQLYDEVFPEPFFKIFAKIIVQAWVAREQAFAQMGEVAVEPGIVRSIRLRMVELNGEGGGEGDHKDGGAGDASIGAPIGFYGMSEEYAYLEMGQYNDMSGLGLGYGDLNQLDWSAMDWNAMNTSAGGIGPLPY